MDIAALALWMFTAGVGLYLLMTTIALRRARIASPPSNGGPPAADVLAGTAATAGVPRPGAFPAAGAPTAGPEPSPAAAATGAAPGGGPPAPPGGPPPIPRARVLAGAGEHPLLEFMHPAFGIAGLGCWLAYVAARYPAFAWISFGALIITIGAGLGWLTTSARSARRRAGGDPHKPGVPVHLIVLHGLAASVTFVLAVLTILTVSRA